MHRAASFTVLIAAFAIPTLAFADIIVDSAPTLVTQFELGTPATNGSIDPRTVPYYDNIENFSGFGFANGGAASVSGILTTKYTSDDISVDPSNYNQPVSHIQWCTANFNAAATTARMRVRFHQDSATGPGTYITGFSFTATAIPSGVSCWDFDNGVSFMNLPSTTRFWAGITFDNSGASTTTAAQLNNLGMGLFTPVYIGSTQDLDFLTSAANIGNVNNPVGAIRNSPFSGNPPAAHGWWITPEPSSLALLGLGALALIRRRR